MKSTPTTVRKTSAFSMAEHVYRNITGATAAGMSELLRTGKTSVVRGQEVREVLNRVTILNYSHERCLFIKHRRNSVFASVAETIWKIGRASCRERGEMQRVEVSI